MVAATRHSIWTCLGVAAVAVTLANCAGIQEHRDRVERDQRVNVPPENYKADLLAFMRTYLNNPEGVREAFVTEPTLRSIRGQTRYGVCLKFDARNSDGRYTGSKEALATYARGRFDQLVESNREQSSDPVREQCKDAAYQRFPELEALKR